MSCLKIIYICLKCVQECPDKKALREAIRNDYHLIVVDLIKRGVAINGEDLSFAQEVKPEPSKRSGQVIVDYLCLVSRINTNLSSLALPEEIVENIAQYVQSSTSERLGRRTAYCMDMIRLKRSLSAGRQEWQAEQSYYGR